MSRNSDLLLTAIAPAIWGSTYIVTTEFLPAGYPLTVAMLRALPAGLLLLPIALLQEPSLPPLTTANLLGLAWLGRQEIAPTAANLVPSPLWGGVRGGGSFKLAVADLRRSRNPPKTC
ncbi:protein of unknown function [Aminobacter niigataensis]|nr:protein of unknown function [Aminobacter niigataensis]